MDQALLSALIKSYGAADTPENVNRIREFYAADPTAAERRAYGLKGQSDESGGTRDMLLNAMIDKAMPPVGPVQNDIEGIAGKVGTNYNMPDNPPQRRGIPNKIGLAPEETIVTPSLSPEEQLTPRGNSVPNASGSSVWDWLLPTILGGIGVASLPKKDGVSAQPQAQGRGAGAGPQGSANNRGGAQGPGRGIVNGVPASEIDFEDRRYPSGESRRPVNTNADERNSEVKNRPVNMDSTPQKQGAWDGEPTNVQNEMAKQAQVKRKVRVSTGR